ncbi:MAG: DUF924 family protein [Candidatus Competibacteraceae bacterium]|nr:DUF924 family protein [Candidatus Competibacteraceae bacterium]
MPSPAARQQVDALLGFWFPPGLDYPALNRRWFEEGRTLDEEIRRRFGTLYGQACRGELRDWSETPRSRLALILLLDQFSRHLYRNTPAAFAQDTQAQALTLEGLQRGHDQVLAPVERVFFYLPLEHAEDRALQTRSVELFESLLRAVPQEDQEHFAGYLDYARRHREVIGRFGRFPDLNIILGRDTTPEEAAFLKQPGSSFL